jgi:hypothetical protein
MLAELVKTVLLQAGDHAISVGLGFPRPANPWAQGGSIYQNEEVHVSWRSVILVADAGCGDVDGWVSCRDALLKDRGKFSMVVTTKEDIVVG